MQSITREKHAGVKKGSTEPSRRSGVNAVGRSDVDRPSTLFVPCGKGVRLGAFAVLRSSDTSLDLRKTAGNNGGFSQRLIEVMAYHDQTNNRPITVKEPTNKLVIPGRQSVFTRWTVQWPWMPNAPRSKRWLATMVEHLVTTSVGRPGRRVRGGRI